MTPACQSEFHCYKILLLQCEVTWLVMVDSGQGHGGEDTKIKV